MFFCFPVSDINTRNSFTGCFMLFRTKYITVTSKILVVFSMAFGENLTHLIPGYFFFE